MTDTDTDIKQFEQDVQGAQNVVGTGAVGPSGKPVVLVSKKKSEDQLADEDIVANRTSVDCDVLEVGDLRAQDTNDQPPWFNAESSERYDPVLAGAEEQPSGENWVGTAGPLAVVTDRTKGHWTPDATEGMVVRLSNRHVYVGQPEHFGAVAGRGVNQPYEGRNVGYLQGTFPIEDGVSVDVAARTVSSEDGWGVAGLSGDDWGRSVERDLSDAVGTTVVKSGRTTDTTTGDILATGVNVNVGYSHDTVRITDCVITEDMGAGGDSGSAVYRQDDGALVGLYFAGSETAGVFCSIHNVIEELGVEPITDWESDTPPAEYGTEPEPDEIQTARAEAKSWDFASGESVWIDGDLLPEGELTATKRENGDVVLSTADSGD